MNEQTQSDRTRSLFLTAITAVFLLTANLASAQSPKYKPGDTVEVDPSGIQSWMKGTVLPFLDKDEPIFQGQYYLARVLIDKWKNTYPEGVLVQLIHVRPGKGEAPNAERLPNDAIRIQPRDNQPTEAASGAKFRPGDRVECDTMNIGQWFKGTVLPFLPKDEPALAKDKTGKYFYIHRVRLDSDASTRPEGGMCFTDRTRLLAGGAPMEIPKTDIPIGRVTTDGDNTLSADRPILDCPVTQAKVRNGARPNSELIKKIVRCDKGEKPASKGVDGAVTVDVTAVQFGTPRPWIYLQDQGGKPGITIHPAKVTYTVKTFYRSRTDVRENWIRIINFFVNDFGEWESGSEEPVKSPEAKDIPRLP